MESYNWSPEQNQKSLRKMVMVTVGVYLIVLYLFYHWA